MTNPNYPTLFYPNGGESISTNEIIIQWRLPKIATADTSSLVYELYYTDNYDPIKQNVWKEIAVLPNSLSQYVWRVGNSLRSSKVRVGIRSRNSMGERSSWSISADNFSIRIKKLQPPILISPINNTRYDKTIQIAFDNSGILGTYSERSSYQIFYSCDSLGIPLTPIAQNVPISEQSIIWDVLNLSPADDYLIQIFLEDDEGNISDSVFVSDIEIIHQGFFIIDTVPPVSAIVINNNATFTTTTGVSVNIVSYDATTAVHAMELSDGTSTTTPEPISDVTNYQLSSGDAVKYVGLLLQDYGGNRNNTQIQRLFETAVELDGVEVADIVVDSISSTAWIVTSAPYNRLYKFQIFPTLVATLLNEPTAIGFFGSYVYIGTKTSNSLGSLMRYNGYEAVDIQDFTDEDSVINAMTVHNGDLYLGFENGFVYSFDGLVFTKLSGIDNPIKTLYSDCTLLYLTARNDTNVYIYNGNEFVSTGE